MKPVESSTTASILARLQNEAKRTGETYNILLSRYVGFRLLYRLSRSRFGDRFLLKGASMFLFWLGTMHRPTRDLDLLGMTADLDELKEAFTEIARIECPEDGVIFDHDKIGVYAIREEQAYGGVRLTLTGFIGRARIPLQIDIGFGDIVTPTPEEVEIPGIIGGIPSAFIKCYNAESSFAEKLEAITRLGLANSRMKDFFDLSMLIQAGNLDLDLLRQAIQATFIRRNAALPSGVPLGLTQEFWTDPAVRVRWNAFVRKNNIQAPLNDLETVCRLVAETIEPVLGQHP